MAEGIQNFDGISNRSMQQLPGGRGLLDPTGTSYESTTKESLLVEVCEPLSEPYLLVVSVAPALVMFENLSFLFAVLMYRRKLKHNNVYTYVTSALVANVLTSSWAFYHFLNYYYGIESPTPSYWWAFRKGMTAGFSLILCGNIGLLIYAIEDSTYIVGRIVSGNVTNKRRNNRLNPKFRMHKALCLIVIAWIVPVVFGLLSMTDWNCTSACTCTLYYSSGTPICQGEKCSRLYTPMSKSYLLCTVLIWALECSFLLFVICKAATSFPGMAPTKRYESTQGTEMDTVGDSSNNNAKTLKSNFRRLAPKLTKSFKFPLILLGLFICCTAPVMILFVLDFAIADFKCSALTVNIVTPLPLLYCVISPILLTRRLSGMKGAVYMALSFSWLKSGCGDVLGTKRKLTGSKAGGSSLSVTRNSEGRIFDSRASIPATPV